MTEQQIEKLLQEKLTCRLRSIRRKWFAFGALVALLIPLTIYATTLTKPHTFIDGDTLSASKLNENFDAIYTKLNAVRVTCPTGFTSIEAHGRQQDIYALRVRPHFGVA